MSNVTPPSSAVAETAERPAIRSATGAGEPRPAGISALLVLGLFTIGWAWLGTSWPALLASCAFLFFTFPATLGWLRRLALVAVAYTGYGMVMGTVFSALSVPLPPQVFISIFTVATLLLVQRYGDWRVMARSGDAAIVVIMAVCAWLALRWGLGEPPEQLVLQLSRGGDNANHMNLIRVIQQGQGYQYSTGIFGLLGGMEFYPQGFAFLTAYTGWLWVGTGHTPSVTETVETSWFLFALQPAIAVLLVLLTVRGLLLRGRSRKRAGSGGRLGIPLAVAGLLISPVVLFMIYANLATFGFQTQMFAMNATVAAVWLATDPTLRNRAMVLLGVSTCVVAVAGSWFLLAPPSAFVALVVAWPMLRRPKTSLGAQWRWFGPALALLVLAAWYPVHRSTPDSSGHLTMSGGVRLFDERLWKSLAVVAVVVVIFEFKRLRRRADPALAPALVVLVGVIVTALLLSLGVAKFQLDAAGKLSYYFFKTLYLPVILGVVLLGLGLARVVADGKLTEVFTNWRKAIATLILIPCALTLVSLTKDLWDPYMDAAPRGPIDPGVFKDLMAAYPDGLPADIDYVATAYCSYLESGQITSWIGGLFTSWDAERQQFYLAVDRPRAEKPSDLVRYIQRSPDRKITVYLQTSCEVSKSTLNALPPDVPVIDREKPFRG